MSYSKQISAIKSAWRAVAPAGHEDNIHVLVQREVTAPDDVFGAGVHYPALVFYAEASDEAAAGPDGRRGARTTQYILEFRADEYEEAWALAEAFRAQLDGLPAGLGAIGWGYASDAYSIDLGSADSSLKPRKVAVVEFTK